LQREAIDGSPKRTPHCEGSNWAIQENEILVDLGS